jgi:thymidylate synthase
MIEKYGKLIKPSKGEAKEVTGVLLELTNPLARLSRTESRGKIFSCLGELCWILRGSASLEEIRYYVSTYSPEIIGEELPSAYGPRLFNWNGINQVENIVRLLTEKKDSRRAVIQVFDAKDLTSDSDEVPCTCTLQFFLRVGRLEMCTFMRSNDIGIGLPHDIFCFTMLQEIIASILKVDLGEYKHFVGSLHLYKKDVIRMQEFEEEGFQSNEQMPKMPQEDVWKNIHALLDIETNLRTNMSNHIDVNALPPGYWGDLSRLLTAFSIDKRLGAQALESANIQMTFEDVFNPYIRSRIDFRKAQDTQMI